MELGHERGSLILHPHILVRNETLYCSAPFAQTEFVRERVDMCGSAQTRATNLLMEGPCSTGTCIAFNRERAGSRPSLR